MGEETPDWHTRELRDLLETILELRTLEEAETLFRDLCTLNELETLSHRWEVARLLDEGLPYQEISRLTGASTATVTRVAHWLKHGEGGYRLALDRRNRRARRRPAG
jgi:TrpR-related protein YerC/YecD